jgi:hypothetical protein
MDSPQKKDERLKRVVAITLAILVASVLVGILSVQLMSPESAAEKVIAAPARATDSTASARQSPAQSESFRTALNEQASSAHDASPHESAVAVDGDRDVHSSKLAESLDRVGLTFLTNDPDVTGMRGVALECAQKAIVDETSLRTDADGITRGKFTIPDSKLHGTFAIEGDFYRIEIPTSPPRGSGDGFLLSELSVTARDRLGDPTGSAMIVQFHPNTDEAAGLMQGIDGERVVGWAVRADANGAVRDPLTMRRIPGQAGLNIGHAESMKSVPMQGDWDVRANDAWLAKLRAFNSR